MILKNSNQISLRSISLHLKHLQLVIFFTLLTYWFGKVTIKRSRINFDDNEVLEQAGLTPEYNIALCGTAVRFSTVVFFS